MQQGRIQKLARDSRGLPFLSEVLAPYLSTGISLAQMGRLSEGIEHMQTGIRLWRIPLAAQNRHSVYPGHAAPVRDSCRLVATLKCGLSARRCDA